MNNYLDSTILVNTVDDEFFKQPSYYALAHFRYVFFVDVFEIEKCSANSLNLVRVVYKWRLSMGVKRISRHFLQYLWMENE